MMHHLISGRGCWWTLGFGGPIDGYRLGGGCGVSFSRELPLHGAPLTPSGETMTLNQRIDALGVRIGPLEEGNAAWLAIHGSLLRRTVLASVPGAAYPCSWSSARKRMFS